MEIVKHREESKAGAVMGGANVEGGGGASAAGVGPMAVGESGKESEGGAGPNGGSSVDVGERVASEGKQGASEHVGSNAVLSGGVEVPVSAPSLQCLNASAVLSMMVESQQREQGAAAANIKTTEVIHKMGVVLTRLNEEAVMKKTEAKERGAEGKADAMGRSCGSGDVRAVFVEASCGIYSLSALQGAGIHPEKHVGGVMGWAQERHAKAVCAYVRLDAGYMGKDFLHVNFACERDLLEAMDGSREKKIGLRLSRCDVLGESCGACVRDAMPEWCRLSVPVGGSTPRINTRAEEGKVVEEGTKAVTSQCEEGLLIDKGWIDGGSRGRGGELHLHLRLHSATDVANVLRCQSKLVLWGHAARVEFPRMPGLMRCHGCKEWGHSVRDCPRLQGLHVRLLFHRRVSEFMRAQIAQDAGAEEVFTGLYVGIKAPSCLVHLVYKDEQGLVQGMERVRDKWETHWAQPPRAWDTQAEKAADQCTMCGQTSHQRYTCSFLRPYIAGSGMRAAVNNAYAWQSPRPAGSWADRLHGTPQVGLAGGVLGGSAAVAKLGRAVSLVEMEQANVLCYSWRNEGKCERLRDGRGCRYEHPPAIRGKGRRVCCAFLDGTCVRGVDCRFEHPPSAAAEEKRASESRQADEAGGRWTTVGRGGKRGRAASPAAEQQRNEQTQLERDAELARMMQTEEEEQRPQRTATAAVPPHTAAPTISNKNNSNDHDKGDEDGMDEMKHNITGDGDPLADTPPITPAAPKRRRSSASTETPSPVPTFDDTPTHLTSSHANTLPSTVNTPPPTPSTPLVTVPPTRTLSTPVTPPRTTRARRSRQPPSQPIPSIIPPPSVSATSRVDDPPATAHSEAIDNTSNNSSFNGAPMNDNENVPVSSLSTLRSPKKRADVMAGVQ